MRTTYYQQSKKSTWVKWVFVALLLVIIACLSYLIGLYHNIQQDKQAGFDETKEIVLRETDLIGINNIERYHGKNAYHIVFGYTENNVDKIVYVPLTNEEEDLMIIDQAEIVSKKTIENQLINECNKCKIISIIPGVEDDELLWELTYVDDLDRYVLEYLSLYDATQSEQYRFRRMYK